MATNLRIGLILASTSAQSSKCWVISSTKESREYTRLDSGSWMCFAPYGSVNSSTSMTEVQILTKNFPVESRLYHLTDDGNRYMNDHCYRERSTDNSPDTASLFSSSRTGSWQASVRDALSLPPASFN